MSEEPGGAPNALINSSSGGLVATPEPNVEDLERRFDLLLEATQRERDRTATRAAATQTRATVLVGATGLVASVDGGSGLGGWAVLLLGIAVGLGIWALVPRAGVVVPVKKIEGVLTAYSATVDLKQTLLKFEIAADDSAAQLVKRRSWIVNAGFIALALGIGISLISGWATDAAESIKPTPTPTPMQIEIVR